MNRLPVMPLRRSVLPPMLAIGYEVETAAVKARCIESVVKRVAIESDGSLPWMRSGAGADGRAPIG